MKLALMRVISRVPCKVLHQDILAHITATTQRVQITTPPPRQLVFFLLVGHIFIVSIIAQCWAASRSHRYRTEPQYATVGNLYHHAIKGATVNGTNFAMSEMRNIFG